jgi:putative DNA primase/helicase
MSAELVPLPSTAEPLPGRSLTDAHREYLTVEGIRGAYLDSHDQLFRSVGDGDLLPDGFDWLPAEYQPGILFGWPQRGEAFWQLRPDRPQLDAAGRPRKYLFGKGRSPQYGLLHLARKGCDSRILIVEGTKQSHAAASAITSDLTTHTRLRDATVVGIPGCWGWSQGGVPAPGLVQMCRGKRVAIILDGDAQANRKVYDAGIALKESLGSAESVEFVWLPCSGDDRAGLDDILKAEIEDRRRVRLEELLDACHPKPARKRPSDRTGAGATWFECWDPATGKLRVKDLAQHLIDTHHWALAAESSELARYDAGVYSVDSRNLLLEADLVPLMGNTYSVDHLANVASAMRGLAAKLPRIPIRPSEPLMCCESGLVDLRTLELMPHTPNFKTMRKVPATWDSVAAKDPQRLKAVTARWEAWAIQQLGEQQLAVFEEGSAQILDPSKTPDKALYEFGPSRTGKSTIGRVLSALVPDDLVSAVELQTLSDDKHAAADLYGMILNVAADMPKSHVENPNLFKSMTGDDLIRGNKKYGPTFKFRNQALFVFSCNTVATVSEQSDAYFDRIIPIAMVRTYIGKTDPRIEAGILEELPGILVRLAKAWQAQYLRAVKDPADRWLPVPEAVTARFRADSDRVARFLNACCTIGIAEEPKTETVGLGTVGPATAAQLHAAFHVWAEQEGLAKIGRKTLMDRVRKAPGVKELRIGGKASIRALNISVHDPGDWEDTSSDADLLRALFGTAPPTPAPEQEHEHEHEHEPPLAKSCGLLDNAIALVKSRARSASATLLAALWELESGELPRWKFTDLLARVQAIQPQLTVADAADELGISPEAALPLLRLVMVAAADELRMREVIYARQDDGSIRVLDPTAYLDPEARKAAQQAAKPVDAAFLILRNGLSSPNRSTLDLPNQEGAHP